MSLFGDNRAQSVQVGAVLLFAILIIFLSIWQVQVVPSENNQVEFQHNIDVQGDLENYRNSLLTVPPRSDAQFSSELRPTRIRLGTQYPTRIIGVNPPPATGSLSTDRGSVNITAEVSDDISLEASAEEILLADRNTTLLTYQPSYSEYTEAPTTRLEHTLLYNQFDERALSVSNQRLIRSSDTGDNLINLVLLEGDVSEQGMRTTLEPVVIDGPTIDVPIEPDSDGELTLSLPTHSPAIWNETIGTDFGDTNARVAAYDGENITIEFDDEISGDWKLRVSKIGLNGGDTGEDELSSIRTIDEPSEEANESIPAAESQYNISWEEPVTSGGDHEVGPGEEIAGSVRVTDRETGEPVESATVDIATSNGTLFNESSDEVFTETGVTNSSGYYNFTITVGETEGNGSLYAAAGDDVDVIKIDVEDAEEDENGGSEEGEIQIGMRIDDLSDIRTNSPRFYVSYDVNAEVDNIEIDAESQESSASANVIVTDSRGGVSLEPGFGSTQEFEISLRVTAEDGSTNQQSVTISADTTNPANNDDLSISDSATLDSSTIRDRTNTNQNNARFDFTYSISDTGSFDRVELHALNINGNGGSDSVSITNRNGNNERVDPNDGANTEYKLAILVIDESGAVVDDRIIQDTADGNDPD